MYNAYGKHPYPYSVNLPRYNSNFMCNACKRCQCPCCFYSQRDFRQAREFTLSELAQYDGTMGKPAYVAVNGIVYDVSSVSKWSGGSHHGLTAGKDLSSQFEGCHGDARLAKLPKVGVLRG